MEYWVWLQSCIGYGTGKIKYILEKYGSAEACYKVSTEELRQSGVFTDKEIFNFSNRSLENARKIIDYCAKTGIRIITIADEEYPDLLRQINSPPTLLYARGDVSLLKAIPLICIVGPREVSTYGQRAAFSVAARLASGGFGIVSGGAVGTDTAVHKGVMAVQGKTICVLGSGIDANYLMRNEELRREISKAGLLISEYQPKLPATKYSFPIRNRIMSALALGTVVIEAGEKSGALITANHAADQGRDVFVIPGSPSAPQYKGSNRLIRDGAKPLLEASDIFEEYIFEYGDKLDIERAFSQKITLQKESDTDQVGKIIEKLKKDEKKKKNLQDNLSKNAKIVYNCLDKEIFLLDDINAEGITGSELLAAITELEIFGYIEALPGGRYSLK